MNDILTRLMNGEDADVIAKEFTESLNAAVQEHKKQMEEKNAAEAKKERCVNDLHLILTLFNDWLAEFYPKLGTVKDNAADIVKTLDETQDDIVELFAAIDELGKILGMSDKSINKKNEDITETRAKACPKNKMGAADNAIFDFLKSCGLA